MKDLLEPFQVASNAVESSANCLAVKIDGPKREDLAQTHSALKKAKKQVLQIGDQDVKNFIDS